MPNLAMLNIRFLLKKMKKLNNYNNICSSWSYVSRNSALDLRACFVEDIECLLAF